MVEPPYVHYPLELLHIVEIALRGLENGFEG